jgi:antitoxin YefM
MWIDPDWLDRGPPGGVESTVGIGNLMTIDYKQAKENRQGTLTKHMLYVIVYILGDDDMLNTNITNFRKNIFTILEQTIKYNEPVNVNTKDGNAVVLSEEDYNGIMETLYLSSIPNLKEDIVEGMKTPVSECVSENEVEW